MSQDKIKVHFIKNAKRFDRIYTEEKSALGRFLDRKLRWDMKERFERTLEECGDITGKTIIDIGCGTGRYMEALLEGNPKLILGVDFASEMISEAQKNIEEKASGSLCKFVVGDFNQISFEDKYDISLAIGIFDYVEEPLPMLKKIRMITKEKLIASFPREGTLRAKLRRWRYKFLSCPVYFFSEREVKHFLDEAGFTDPKLEIIGQIIFVVTGAGEKRGSGLRT